MLDAPLHEFTFNYLQHIETNNKKKYLKTIKWIKAHSQKRFPKLGNWILAGSGNYEKTIANGKYRETCNTIRDKVSCSHHLEKGFKVILNHCSKLDCVACFTYGASERAREIDRVMRDYQRQAKSHGLKIGNIMHVILVPKKDLTTEIFRDYRQFLKFRRKEIYNKLKECGIFGGYVVTHAWSLRCKNCGEKEQNCKCEGTRLDWEINVHFHILGFGYLLNTSKFKKKYRDWVVINAGRRKTAYNTAFYLLTHCAMWRNHKGRLMSAYEPFGVLRGNKFKVTGKEVKVVKLTCPHCKAPLRRVIEGVELIGDSPKILTTQDLKTQSYLQDNFVHNGNLQVKIVPEKVTLGREVTYRRSRTKREIQNVEELNQLILKNRKSYLADLKEKRMRNERNSREVHNQGNGYG
ncbi:MAG: hypothetical protein ACFFAO_00350 [Candidatus Hermodarchaeota archaeon]